MEDSCHLLQQLINTENERLRCTKKEEKYHILHQLLDLLLEVEEDVNTRERNEEQIEGFALGKSKLYSTCRTTKLVSEEGPGSVEFSSEALYCKRLIDTTPTDERLVSNPTRVLHITDEIDNIHIQNWLCLGEETPPPILMSCSCLGDHMMGIVKLVCRCLLHENWADIRTEVVASEPKDAVYKEAHNQNIVRLGIKLYHTFIKVKVCWGQRSDVQNSEDYTYSMQSLNQIVDMLPLWIKESKYKNIVTKSKVDMKQLNRLVQGLCTRLGEDSMEVHYAHSESTIVKEPEKNCLKELVLRVNNRLHGCEDCLVQMLTQQSYWSESEWIVCLEKNVSILCDRRLCKLLYDAAMIMKGRQSHTDNLNRLLKVSSAIKVFLSSFASLPPLLQTQMCEAIWCHPRGQTLFSTFIEETTNFHQEMTSAFNRLVNVTTEEGLDEAVGRVAMVALQCPSDTLYTAVNRAVSNSAALQSVLKVLQMLPSLGRFHLPDDSKPLLVQVLKDVIESCDDMTSTEEGNLADLVEQLIQPFRLPSSCPYQDQPLLMHSLLIESCIMPNLHSGVMDDGCHDDHTQNARLEMCVKLLNTSLTRFEASQLNQEWIPDLAQFPIILCLCDILDQSNALWDRTSCLTPDGKELVVDLLLRITSILESSHQQDETFQSGLQWLINRTHNLHWTTQLQLGIALQGCRHDNKKAVPECLFDLCNLSSEDWAVLPGSETGTSSLSEQLMVFFQCCRISDQLLSQLHQTLRPIEVGNGQEFYQATLVAMTTVLPQCTLGEIQRLARVLKLLIEESVLMVPLSSQFVTCLPMTNLADHRVTLCMCQFLTSLVTLLASEYCQDWVSIPLWGHTTKAVVMCLKIIASDIPTVTAQCQSIPAESTNSQQEATATPGSVFALTQILCHTCYMITLIPNDVTDQLFVLTLDLLGRIEELLPSNTKQDIFEWTNQRTDVENLIDKFENREQRQTLVQKLAISLYSLS